MTYYDHRLMSLSILIRKASSFIRWQLTQRPTVSHGAQNKLTE